MNSLNLESLYPIRTLWVTLSFTEEARFHFFHQAAVNAYLRHLLGKPKHFENVLTIDTPESGRIVYRTGDQYRFSVIALGGGETLLTQLIDLLRRAAWLTPAINSNVPLRNNVRLVQLQDGLTGQTITEFDELSCYTQTELDQEAKTWRNKKVAEWHWLSPARVLKEKSQRQQQKGERRYCRDIHHVDASLLLNRIWDTVAELLRRRGEETPARTSPPFNASIISGHIFWADSEYYDAAGKPHVQGGLLGHTVWQFTQHLPLHWWHLLVLGQYTGIGQQRSFGLGRYEWVTPDGELTYRRASAAGSLLAQVIDTKNLQQAWLKVSESAGENRESQNGREPEIDERYLDDNEGSNNNSMDDTRVWLEDSNQPQDPIENRTQKLEQLAHQLLNGKYPVPSMRGYQTPKKNGGFRALQVPPFWDRVLQRAVIQILSPKMDKLMDNRSYGFRQGRSRMMARDAIQSAWRKGQHWVFEADISDYFNSVQWPRLLGRLRGLLYDDPIVECLMQWVQASVEISDRVHTRERGLPQGAPVSPLLANVLLDDFDADMRVSGLHLVRFADDFVIMCASEKEAIKAEDTARRSLLEHGFTLNDDKTSITKASDGFKFLGYLFVNDMALDVGSGDTQLAPSVAPPIDPTLDRHWSDLVSTKPNPQLFGLSQKETTVITQGKRHNFGTLLCVAGEPTVVSLKQGRVVAQRDETVLFDTPMQGVQSLLILGAHHVTTPALRAMMKADIPVHFASTQGYYEGSTYSHNRDSATGHQLWLKQCELSNLAECSIAIAKALVSVRIQQQAELLRQRGVSEWSAIKQYVQRLDTLTTLEQLNGIEGSAARLFFKALQQHLPPVWGFDGRNRRPPRDPVNVLLSLGYTVLYAHSDTLLRVAGLLPWQGFYHQTRGKHAALASDLMEPLRHIVERVALNQISQNRIQPEHFWITENGECRIQHEARKAYLSALFERFHQQQKSGGTIYEQLYQQAVSLVHWIRGQGEFTPCGQRYDKVRVATRQEK